MFQKKTTDKSEGMPGGVQMVVRALFPNFNPDEFSAQIDDVRNKTAATVVDFTARLSRIEHKLDVLISLFEDDSPKTEEIARASNERIGIDRAS